MRPRLAFAIPGDESRVSGGFLYERCLLRALRRSGCEVTHLRLPDGFPNPSDAEIDAAMAQLSAVPDGVPLILDGFLPAALGAARLRRLNASLVPIVHHPLGLETGLDTARAEVLLAAEREALACVDRIIVPSRFIGRLLSERFAVPPARLLVVPPGFDAPIRDRTPSVPPLILAVGLLAPRKGHDVLIDALARIQDLDWRARIIGAAHDPDVAKALAARIETAGLGGRVDLLTGASDAARDAAYREASLFALATRYEGYGIVFGEAMRFGLPIVSTSVGAVPETVGAAGRLVAPDDPVAFADALADLLGDPDRLRRLASRSAGLGAALPTWEDAVATTRHGIIGE